MERGAREDRLRTLLLLGLAGDAAAYHHQPHAGARQARTGADARADKRRGDGVATSATPTVAGITPVTLVGAALGPRLLRL